MTEKEETVKKADVEAKKFPETLYVTRETDNQGATIALMCDYAVEDIDEAQEGSLVGIYQLVRVDRLSVAKKLTSR